MDVNFGKYKKENQTAPPMAKDDKHLKKMRELAHIESVLNSVRVSDKELKLELCTIATESGMLSVKSVVTPETWKDYEEYEKTLKMERSPLQHL